MSQRIQARSLIPNLIAGVAVGVIAVIFMFSFAAVIFAGDLSSNLSGGVGLLLFGAICSIGVSTLLGSVSGILMIPQGKPTAISAIIALSIATRLPASASDETIFINIVIVIAITTLITAIVYYLMGHFRMGQLTQYIPYPVIAGFLAGTGWLLVKSAFATMVPLPYNLAELETFISQAPLWIPGLIFGAVLLWMTTRYHHYLIMPAMLLGAVVLFYIVFFLSGTTMDAAIQAGWLNEPLAGGITWQPVFLFDLQQVQWSLLFGEGESILTILLLCIVSLLLNVTALESEYQTDADLNRELKLSGMSNALSALGGSVVGFHHIGLSTISHQMGVTSRMVGIVAVAVCISAFAFGALVLAVIPVFVLGGVVMYLGLLFLYRWVYLSWFRFSRIDFAIIIIILIAIAEIGFLEGIALGLAIAVFLFILRYSRIPAIKHAVSGDKLHSNVDRTLAQRRILEEQGGQTEILILRGYILFGTAAALLATIRERLADAEQPPVRYVVFDFQEVTGVDASALHNFVKLRHLSHEHGFTVIYSHLAPNLLWHFENETFADGSALVTHRYPNLDYALEWVENEILSANDLLLTDQSIPVEDILQQILQDPQSVQTITPLLEKLQAETGEVLFHQGDAADQMYFVESGGIAYQLEIENGENIRLRKLGAGTIVGLREMFTDAPYDMSVVVEQSAVLHRLSADALAQLEQSASSTAATLKDYFLHVLARELDKNTDLIRELLEIEHDS